MDRDGIVGMGACLNKADSPPYGPSDCARRERARTAKLGRKAGGQDSPR